MKQDLDSAPLKSHLPTPSKPHEPSKFLSTSVPPLVPSAHNFNVSSYGPDHFPVAHPFQQAIPANHPHPSSYHNQSSISARPFRQPPSASFISTPSHYNPPAYSSTAGYSTYPLSRNTPFAQNVPPSFAPTYPSEQVSPAPGHSKLTHPSKQAPSAKYSPYHYPPTTHLPRRSLVDDFKTRGPLSSSTSSSAWLQSGSGQPTHGGTKLCWELLPHDPARSKQFIHFDITFPPNAIGYRQNSPHDVQHTHLSYVNLEKPAADTKLTEMVISFQGNLFAWDIDVKRSDGIRVRDVFDAIFAAFQIPLTSDERKLILPRQREYEEAFRLRCKLVAEQSQVWKRVDTLLHETFFRGLTQSKFGGGWGLDVSGTMPTYNKEVRNLLSDSLIHDLGTASNFPSILSGSHAEHNYLLPDSDPGPNIPPKFSNVDLFKLPLSAAFVPTTDVDGNEMFPRWNTCRICNIARLNALSQHSTLCTLISSFSWDPSQDYTWAFFCRYVPLGAFFDSLGRGSLPMAQLGRGRIGQIDRLEANFETLRNSVSWLHGPSGTGKSIVAYTLASRLSQKDRLLGSFFFSRMDASCRSARSVMLALVYQLGLCEPRAKEKIIAAVYSDPGIISPSRDLREQFVRLLVEPLEVVEWRTPSRVFVIDAVEQCQDGVPDLILLLTRLLDRLGDVGVNLQIFITSRNRPVGVSIQRHGSLITLDITRNAIDIVPDIGLFLRGSFEDIFTRHRLQCRRPWPPDEVLHHFVDRAVPHFTTASVIIKFVEIPDHDPKDMVDLIYCLLIKPSSHPESPLDVLYKSIISTSDDLEQAYVHLTIVVNLAGTMSCSQLDKLLNRGPNRMFAMHSVLSKLPPLVHVPTSHHATMRVCHESLRDFLSDPLRCGNQFIPQALIHRLIAYSSLCAMLEDLPDDTQAPLCSRISQLATKSSAMSLDDFDRTDVLSSMIYSPPEPMQFLDTLWRVMQGHPIGSTTNTRTKLALGYFRCTWQILQHLDFSIYETIPAFRFLEDIRSLPVLLAFPIFMSFESLGSGPTLDPSTLQHEPRLEAFDAVTEIMNHVYTLKEGCKMSSDALGYACTHWAYHLSLAEWDDDLRSILMAFMRQRLQQWLVRAWCLQDLETCLRTLSEVQNLCLTANPPVHFGSHAQYADADIETQQKAGGAKTEKQLTRATTEGTSRAERDDGAVKKAEVSTEVAGDDSREGIANKEDAGTPSGFSSGPGSSLLYTEAHLKFHHMSLNTQHTTECSSPPPGSAPHPAHTSPPSVLGDRYPCDLCDRSFTRSHDRRRHYETMHAPTPVLHRCRYCGKAFSRADSLKRHLDSGCEILSH